jgi:cephalosporin-C deacetylase-like acetyl esterase
MKWWTGAVFALYVSTLFARPAHPSRVVVDGQPSESFWQQLIPRELVPTQPGVRAVLGGQVRAAVAGTYLYLSAGLPEPSGQVTALAMGRDPLWQGGSLEREETIPRMYTFGAVDGEDFVRFVIVMQNGTAWMVQVGPLGGYSVKYKIRGEAAWHLVPAKRCNGFLIAARIEDQAWSVEAAIPLDELGPPAARRLRVEVLRNRAERPGEAAEQWRWPSQNRLAEVPALPVAAGSLASPFYRPPLLGNSESPIEVGYRKTLPPLDSGWIDSGWRNVPAWSLLRNEAAGRLPRSPTQVKLLHDNKTLAVLAQCIEPDRVIAETRPRDELSEDEDYFQVCLAVSGPHYVEYAINPKGSILDALGFVGNLRSYRYSWDWWTYVKGNGMPSVTWNSPVRGMAREKHGQWLARLDLPLEAISAALGEPNTPRNWRILLFRSRPARDGEHQEISVFPITESSTPFCPARYRRLELVEKDSEQAPIEDNARPSGELTQIPTRVFSPRQRKQLDLAAMLNRNVHSQVVGQLEKEAQEWAKVDTLTDWENFRARRLQALRASLGPFPPRIPLRTCVTSEYRGDGYRRQNLVFESRPGVWVTANFYLPAKAKKHMPGIIIIAGHHASKTQFDLQDAGILWARVGCAVLVMDQVGFGERSQTYPWDYEAYYSMYDMGEQLYLIDSSFIKWMVWDTMRGIDLLLARRDVDTNKIMVVGAVAGGGDPAAVTAAVDPRVSAVAPFNFGDAAPATDRENPKKNGWPLNLADPGLLDWDTTGALRHAITDQFLQWTICASVSPRRFIFSHEVGWNVNHEPAWKRYQKVFGLCNVLDHLAEAHGFGSFPGLGECWELGPAERQSLDRVLHRWFGIPIPQADLMPVKDNLAKRSDVIRQPVSQLTVLTPRLAARLHVRPVHAVAQARAEAELSAARSHRDKLTPAARFAWLRAQLGKKLGDIEPVRHPDATVYWTRQVRGMEAQGVSVKSEPGITIPTLLLLPRRSRGGRPPVVVAVSEEGKGLFVLKRGEQIKQLLAGGIAVCLPDVRGTGETTPDARRDTSGDESVQANWEFMLGETLLGKRLKDLRTVIAYLGERNDLDAHRMGLWGDSFDPPNPAHLLIHEPAQWQIGPQIEQEAEPLGGLSALLGALYESSVRTVVVHGGLVSYLSILNKNFAYVPQDVIVPGILSVGDIADVAAALSPRPLMFAGLVDGQDELVSESGLRSQLQRVYEAYGTRSSSELLIRSGVGTFGIADWFLAQLR